MQKPLLTLFLLLAAALPLAPVATATTAALPAAVTIQDGAGAEDAGDAAAPGEEAGEKTLAEDPEGALKEKAEEAKAFFKRLMDDPAGTLKEWALDDGARLGGKLLLFLIVLLASGIVARMFAGVVRRALSASKLEVSELLRNFAVNTTRNVVFFMGLLIALTVIGVNIGPFLAAFGVIGFVVGFALQDTMGNFAAGVMILLYRPYDIGDVVNAGGVTGAVDAQNLVSTTLLTPDNQRIIVPNGSIWGGTITNITANDTRRVDLTAGIGYGDDIAQAEQVLARIVAEHDLVLKDPEPVIKLHELADSSVNFVVRIWSKTSDYWDVYWDITRAIKVEFDKEGISIPYPQRDVHMHQVSAS